MGAALAGRTAAGLQQATGIPSVTLARLIGESQDGGGLALGAVVVVDEAGMVGSRQLAAVADVVEEAQGKLILVGDDHQLPEISAGGLFQALANRLPAVELTDNTRQRHHWERAAIAQLRDGPVDKVIETYRQRGRVNVGQSRGDTMAKAVADWYRHVTLSGDLASGLLLAHSNDTVTQLNRHARSLLAAAGRLNGPTLEAGEGVYQAGDRTLCRRNQSRLGLLNGDLATVTSVDQETKSLMVCLDRDPETGELPGAGSRRLRLRHDRSQSPRSHHGS